MVVKGTRKMAEEQSKVKLRTIKGKILTVNISNKSLTHIYGVDKFGNPIVLPLVEIDSMLPISGTQLKKQVENGKSTKINS